MARQGAAGAVPCPRVHLSHQVAAGARSRQELRRVLGSVPPGPVRLRLADGETGEFDTTMAFTDFAEQLMPFPRRALSRLAALGDRILLGSDFPSIPYPCLHQLQALERLDLGREWLRAVCHDNAADLFGLSRG